jgi:hypothetical protein
MAKKIEKLKEDEQVIFKYKGKVRVGDYLGSFSKFKNGEPVHTVTSMNERDGVWRDTAFGVKRKDIRKVNTCFAGSRSPGSCGRSGIRRRRK